MEFLEAFFLHIHQALQLSLSRPHRRWYNKKLDKCGPGRLLSSPTIELGCTPEEEVDDGKKLLLDESCHTKP